MTARRLHRITAYPVAVFIALHLANHIALFWGPEAHLAVQSLLRPIYRNPCCVRFTAIQLLNRS